MKNLLFGLVILLLAMSVEATTLRSLGPNNPSNLEVPSNCITFATTAAMEAAAQTPTQFQLGDCASPKDTNAVYLWTGATPVWNQVKVLGTDTPTFTSTPSITPTLSPTCNTASTPICGNQGTFTFTPTGSPTYTPTIAGTLTPTYTPVYYSGKEVVLTGKYLLTNQSAAISWSAGQATYSLNSHGFNVGDWVAIEKATPGTYNSISQITSTTNNTFNYSVGGNPTTVSSGTSRILFWMPGGRVINPQLLSSAVSLHDANQGTSTLFTFANQQPDSYFGFRASGAGSTNSSDGENNANGTGVVSGKTFQVLFWDAATGAPTFGTSYFYIKLTGIQ